MPSDSGKTNGGGGNKRPAKDAKTQRENGKTTAKERIVDAAWRLFREKGYQETTIEDILTACNTSRGTFYRYFNSKDSLLSSLSTLFDDNYRQLMQQMPPEMNSVDKLIELCRNCHRMIRERIHPELLASLYSSQVMPRGDKHLLDKNRYYYRITQQIIEEGQKRGEIIDGISSYDLAHYYIMCERAIIYDFCISSDEYDLVEYTDRTIPLLLAGIRT